jgi:hypothetical protein
MAINRCRMFGRSWRMAVGTEARLGADTWRGTCTVCASIHHHPRDRLQHGVLRVRRNPE